jgi:3-dehydroquinate synthase
MVALSLGAKKWFVEVDEFDQNERLLLNFGHSFGHALESCSAYQVTHGVAVGVGCLSAVNFSAAELPDLPAIARVAALRRDLETVLGSVDGLAQALAKVERSQFFHYWQSDKKHTPAEYRPILLDETGSLYRAALPRNEATDDRIWNAFDQARRELA